MFYTPNFYIIDLKATLMFFIVFINNNVIFLVREHHISSTINSR